MKIPNQCKLDKVAGDDCKYSFGQVAILRDGAAATNGRVMVLLHGENDCTGYIPAGSLKSLQVGGKKHEVEVSGGRAVSTKSGISADLEQDMTWPDVDQVIPPESAVKMRCTVSARLLLAVLQAMGDDEMTELELCFTGDDSALRINSRLGCVDATALVMPIARKE